MNCKYKKLLFIGILSILALISIPNESKAVTYTDSETGITWNYTLSGNNAIDVYIDSYSSLSETLTIPNQIDGHTVTEIRGGNTKSAGYGLNILNLASNETIKEVILPETLTKIGTNSFCKFEGLTSITIPKNVTSIGMLSFFNCTSLTTLTIPDKVETIETVAFSGCSNLTELTLPVSATYTTNICNNCSKLETINLSKGTTGELADRISSNYTNTLWYYINSQSYGYNGIKNINILDGITKIGNYAFNWNSKIENVNIAETVNEIGNYAFNGCIKLKSVNLSESIEKFGNNAFSGCSNIETMNLPESVKEIGNECFYNCYKWKLDNFSLPNNLETLGDKAFYNCGNLKGKLVFSDKFTTVPQYAFYNCYGITEIEFGNSVTEIKNGAFQMCRGIKTISLPENLQIIEDYAFHQCTELTGDLVIPDKVTKIGNYAFENNMKLNGKLILGSGLETIGNYAFANCIGINGDLIIPNKVTSIGQYCFYDCSGIDGTVKLSESMNKIDSFVFYKASNISKFIISASIKNVEKFAIYGVSDLYYLGDLEDLHLSSIASGGKIPFIHTPNCTHKLAIDIPEGYEIINKETNELLQPGEYNCETTLKIGLKVKTGHEINNDLKLVISKQGKYKGSENTEEKLSLTNFDVYEISNFNRDYTITIKDTSVTTDLALRTYIHQVNYNDLEVSRIPNAQNESGIISYNHIKKPVEVNKGDLVTFKVRIYNEGDKPGVINEISKYLPEGLVLANSETNRRYGWVQGENGKISTRYFENKTIQAYTGGNLPYEEISLICKVTSSGTPNADTRLVTIAEISEGVTKDTDSTYGQITSRALSTYKLEEANASTENSYVRNDDDDTDFENVIIHPTLPVEYTIKVTKIDTDTSELLAGAVFNLKDTDGNIVSTATTDENGVLSFGLITSYGEGTDIYYIEEALAPEGYALTEKETIEVTVTKTLIDEVLGTYSLKVVCQTLNYSTNITRYDFIPISTADQLAKVGSGTWIEYEGTEYLYAETANYKLVNDIDLDGIAWTPINKKISGIFDGNGHSIKNLTIVSNEEYTYSEVGLFRYFSGIVQSLNLEDVNIVVPGMVTKDLDTITGKTCVGGFAGYMEKGTVKNCSISGTIAAGCSNVGGFVGHSAENNIIKFQNCTNSAEITAFTGSGSQTGYNIGGMIGCAVGSLSLNDCINEGEIKGIDKNIGGLVGFVQSTGYEEVAIKAGYTEEDKTITLLVGNTKTTGKYDIILENRDVKTLGFIAGAKYTVYNSKLEEMSGYEEIQLDNGNLKVATVNINYEGTDTYYIKELEPAPGYERLKSYVKLVVSRYWDAESSSFRVEVNAENIVDDKIEEEEKKENTYKELESLTGSVIPNITFEGVGWNNDKVAFIDCVNKANLSGYMDVGGVLGTAYCKVQMNRCNNLGNITAQGYGKAGGMIAEVRKQDNNNFVEIQNCVNEGEIASIPNNYESGSASGIIAHSISNTKIINCVNRGIVNVGRNSAGAGIIAHLSGTAEIRECTNEGDLIALVPEKNNVNCVVGGIVGKNSVYSGCEVTQDENNIYVYDCINRGDIVSATHCGGIIALSSSKEVKIENCINEDNTIKGTSSDSGGMIGFASVKKLQVKNCITKNTEFSQDVGGNNTYGFTGGMVGNFAYENGWTQTRNKDLLISNCTTIDCIITSTNKEPAGILGGVSSSNSSGYDDDVTITDCNVERCTIKNIDGNSNYASSGGITGNIYRGGDIKIKNCNVTDSYVASLIIQGYSGSDTNVGGIVGIAAENKSLELLDCKVKDCEIYNSAPNDSCGNTAGIIAVGQKYGSSAVDFISINNCDVIDSRVETLSGNLAGTIATSYQTRVKIKNCDNEGITLFSTSTSGGACTNTGGIIANSYDNNNTKMSEIEDCSVKGNNNSKVVIYGRGRNVAGAIAFSYNNITVKNIVVKDIIIESEGGNFSSGNCDTVSGIMGGCNAIPSFENCLVENASIEGIVANSAGILGQAYSSSPTTFKDITVKNTNILNEMTWNRASSNSTAAGIVGSTGSKNTYTNCNVEDCEITGSGCVTSGMVAVCNSGIFNNCMVKDTTVKKNYGNVGNPMATTSVAGMVGTTGWYTDFKMADCSVENVNISGDTMSIGGMVAYTGGIEEFKRNKVNNLTITNTSNRNAWKSGSIGGMIGDINPSSTQTIEDCDVTNFTAVSRSTNIGGIVGTANNGSNNITVKFKDCDLDNLNLTYTNEIRTIPTEAAPRCIGGLIAIGSKSTTSEYGINVVAENCTSKNSNYTAKAGNYLNAENTADMNVETENIIVKGGENTNSSIGSFVGWAKSAEFTNSTITNNILKNDTTLGKAGGAIGANYYTSSSNKGIVKANNVTVNDCTITAKGVAGGIMGYGAGEITNSSANNCTVKQEDTDATNEIKVVGGLVGFLGDPSSKIEGSTVSGSEIEGMYYAGGIVGFGEGDLTNNKVIENSTVTTTGDYAVGGIIGMTKNTSSEITNCDVENIAVTGATNYIGGIAGYANNTISGCDVNQAGIVGAGENVVALGGILGHSAYASLSNCSIANTIITGNTTDIGAVVGNIYGTDNCTSGCTVDEATVKINPELTESTTLDESEEQSETETESEIEPEEQQEPETEPEENADGEVYEPDTANIETDSDEGSEQPKAEESEEQEKDSSEKDNTSEIVTPTKDISEPKQDEDEETEEQEDDMSGDDDNEENNTEDVIVKESEEVEDDSTHIDSSSI